MKRKADAYERLEDLAETFARVDPTRVESALRAEQVAQQHGRPHAFSIWALRSQLLRELVSTGGRPGRRAAVSRKKVPLTGPEWKLLDTVTSLINGQGVNATSGQVAGILLQQSLAEVLERLETRRTEDVEDMTSARNLTDDQLKETLEGILAAAASAEAQLEQLGPVARELLRRMRTGKGAEHDEETTK